MKAKFFFFQKLFFHIFWIWGSKRYPLRQQTVVTGFLLGYLSDPEDGRDVFTRIIEISPNYKVINKNIIKRPKNKFVCKIFLLFPTLQEEPWRLP
jgi:hypothetical protein